MSSNNSRRPLFKKRSAPPPSATTSMLESMLDETKAKKRRKKPKKQRPLLNDVSSNATTNDKIILPTQGLEDAPTIFPKKFKNSTARKVEATTRTKKTMRSAKLGAPKQPATKPATGKTTTKKDRFPLTLSIGRGKKRTRDRSTSFLKPTSVDAVANAVNFPTRDTSSNDGDKGPRVSTRKDVNAMSDSWKEPLSLDEVSFRASDVVADPSVSWKPANDEPAVRANIMGSSFTQAPVSNKVEVTNMTTGRTNATTKTTAATKKAPPPKRKAPNNDNFVRLNMKNSAGACRGARNKSKSNRRFDKSTDKRPRKKKMLQSGVDPLDDFMDGVYSNNKAPSKTNDSSLSKAPQCARHQRPCKLLVVKKNTTGNKGRKFYVCSLPRGEQCEHFEWADNTVEAAQRALARNTSFSGFVARQVAAYTDRFQTLTVPELRDEAKKRNLDHRGKRKQLLMRLSLWVRDELVAVGGGQLEAEAAVNDDSQQEPVAQDDDESSSDDDDSSVSSEELEVCHATEEVGKDVSIEKSSSNQKCNEEAKDEPPKETSQGETTPLTLEEQLQNLFGHEEFREGQEWAVRRCLEKQRTLLVAPTGFGKSLCYALPAALLDGVCIVVSPLISLMQDQLRQLPPRIPAATLSGSLTAAAMAATIDDVIRNRLKILFVSPERLTSPSFQRLFQTRWNHETKTRERSFPKVSLLCVDEAHCVSQWAHNFRPSYLRLKSMLELMQPESVLAMTATAGPRVVKDICDALYIPHCEDSAGETQGEQGEDDIVGGHGVKILAYDRDNIDVCCRVFSNEGERLSMLQKLLGENKTETTEDESSSCLSEGSLAHGSVIVYVWRQRDTEVVAENLMASGIEGVVIYHGGMDSGARAKAQSKFMRGKARICVATMAFGMGINKSDVVGVVHMYLPSSPESYLQETGRAGRDGRPAKAIALVLGDEVVVKHSLAHSDMLSTSQIKTLLQILQNQVLETLNVVANDIGQEVDVVATYGASFNVALPIESTVKATDCKVETIETILSLLEGTDREQPLLKIQGTTTDQATVTLKRMSLEKLSKTEKLADCIMKCGTCLDSPEATKNQEEEDQQTQEKRFLAYSFGSHSFSVARCASLLGATAEPRHVFAALRRLQNSGDLELLLDGTPAGRALHVKVELRGVQYLASSDTCLDELACDLARRSSENVAASAKKALDAKRILHRVASVEPSDASEDGMSPSLAMFRELVQTYFDGQEVEDTFNDEEELPRGAKASMRNELRVDISSLLRDMKTFPDFQHKNGVIDLDILSPHSRDYTALALTKFMHALDTTRAPYAAFGRHPLYGKWRDVEFCSLLKEIEEVLQPTSSESAY